MAAVLETPKDQWNEIWWPILTANEANKMNILSYILEPSEKVIMCPYDNYHWIRFKRTSSHLPRCRRNYQKAMYEAGEEISMIVCRYNDTHEVMKPEIQYHEAQCSNRFVSAKSELDAIEKYAPVLDRQPHLKIEEWDIYPSIKSYDPREKMRDYFYYIPHANATLSKGEKKKFQASQRLRFYTHVSGEWWAGLDKPSRAPGDDAQVVDSVALQTAPTLGDHLWALRLDNEEENTVKSETLERTDEALLKFADLETTSRGSTVELFKLNSD